MTSTDIVDPIEFSKEFWPNVVWYKEQREIIDSVWYDDETYVPAGNMLGKDFVAAFIVLWYFLSRHPCKIVTTSVKEQHLNVLWGEIEKFIRTSKCPLLASKGGPLLVNNNGMRKIVKGEVHKDSYVMKLVANDQTIQSFSGHHVTPDPGQPIDSLPRNLFVADEASGLRDEYYKLACIWAKRMLIFGNTWECQNFFRRAVEGNPETRDPGGNVKALNNDHYERRIIHIRAEDSPNVRYGKYLIKRFGRKEVNRRDLLKLAATIIPGVLTFSEYEKRRRIWDKVQQCVSLDAEFYKGAELLLYPPDWLELAHERADDLGAGMRKQLRKVMGLDPGEGTSDTCWVVIDAFGIIELVSEKTENTSTIVGDTIARMKKWSIKPQDVLIDRGGGGQQHADRIRVLGHKVRTVGFGEPATPPKKRGTTQLERRKEQDEIRYVYKNRRAEMFGMVSRRIDPNEHPEGFGIPRELTELRRQLAPIPRLYDEEGRMWLPPKNKKNAKDLTVTLTELIGCSPDQADALALAVFGLDQKQSRIVLKSVV